VVEEEEETLSTEQRIQRYYDCRGINKKKGEDHATSIQEAIQTAKKVATSEQVIAAFQKGMILVTGQYSLGVVQLQAGSHRPGKSQRQLTELRRRDGSKGFVVSTTITATKVITTWNIDPNELDRCIDFVFGSRRHCKVRHGHVCLFGGGIATTVEFDSKWRFGLVLLF
jgi:hypothetical protein